MWVVSRHEDVVSVLKDKNAFLPSANIAEMFQKLQICDEAVAIMDEVVPLHTPRLATSHGAVHARLRGVVQRRFAIERIRAYEPAVVKIATDLLDGFVEMETVDLVERYCRPISVRSVLGYLGIPSAHTEEVAQLANQVTRLFVGRLDRQEQISSAKSFRKLKDFFVAFLREKHMTLGDDVASDLADAIAQNQVTTVEGAQLMFDILSAGLDTTLKAMSWTLFHVLGNKGLWETLANGDAGTIKGFAEEGLRINLAQMGLVRVATSDLHVGDALIKKGEAVYVLHIYGNRDPGAFSKPSTFEANRSTDARSLTFGHGIHFCLGAQLARTEIEVALRELSRRYPALSIDGRSDAVSIVDSGMLNSVQKLTVLLR